jgi:predicted DNA-binding protein with PD1-like motif
MQYLKTTGGYAIRLERGEEVWSALAEFAESHLGGNAAMVVGIGAIENPVLGWFDRKAGEYVEKEFEGDWEIVSLLGNITTVDGKPFPHLHASLSGRDMQMVGGHFFRGVCAATVEVFLRDRGVAIERVADPSSPLKLWSLPNK